MIRTMGGDVMPVRILQGHCLDVLAGLPAASVHCCVTSPPYWQLRRYGGWELQALWGSLADFRLPRRHRSRWRLRMRWRAARREGGVASPNRQSWIGAWGLEPTPEAYVAHTVAVFREVRRVLRPDGTLWLNLGPTYWNDAGGQQGAQGWVGAKNREANRQMGRQPRATGARHALYKRKDLVPIPWLVAIALQADGWYLRAEVIWAKPNPLPESCTDRPTRSHEQLLLLSKRPRYYYDAIAIAEPVTGNAHGRGAGVNPKSRLDGFAPGQVSASVPRLHRVPVAWQTGPGAHDRIPRGRYLRSRQNAEFSAAVHELVARRNKRSVWTMPLQGFSAAGLGLGEVEHFATFPPRLVEPCVLAGTSERGCCPACGAPWRRVVARAPAAPRLAGSTKCDGADERTASVSMKQRTAGARADGAAHDQPFAAPQTIGWRPSCACPGAAGLEPIPCTVLDPCAGAGTTGLVADRLGRDAVLIELKPEYVELARRRIAGDAPLFAAVEGAGDG